MRRTILVTLLSLLALPAWAPAWAEDIGSVGYRFKWLGPNDKIVIEAFDDPDVPGVTCYISRARTGGIRGALGLAEDPPYASISCHQVGPVDAAAVEKVRSPHEVVRFWDPKRRALVYLTYTDRIIEGSPQNSISVVPIGFR